MAKLDLDFGGINAIPPEGCWRYIINDARVKLNKAKDGHYIELDVMMLDAPDEKFEGHKPFPKPIVSLKDTARFKLQELLQAVTGDTWEEDGMSLEINDTEDPPTVPILIGKTFLGISVHEPYQNRINFKVDSYLPDDNSVQIGAAVSAPSVGI
jgi:hypothetical protein